MRKLLWVSLAAASLILAYVSYPSAAGNPNCPTRPVGDSTNACASTAFVQGAIGPGFPPTGAPAAGRIIVGLSATTAAWQTGTTWFDTAYCNTVGYIIVRLSGAWTCAQGVGVPAQWYGLICDGDVTKAAANSAAIQAAIVAVQPDQNVFSGGEVNVILTGGVNSTCPITSGVISVPGRVKLSGTGRGTNLSTVSGTGDVITTTGGDVLIENMQMSTSVARTAGAFINMGAGGGLIRNIVMTGPWDGIIFNGTTHVTVTDVIATTVRHRGIICTGTADLIVIERVIMSGLGIATSSDAGYWTDRCGDIQLRASQFLSFEKGIALEACTPCDIAGNLLTYVVADHNRYGIFIKPNGAASTVSRNFLDHFSGTSGAGDGINITTAAGGVVNGLYINAPNLNDNANAGAQISAAAAALARNIAFQGAGQIAGNVSDGIIFGDNTQRFSAMGLCIGVCGSWGGNGGFGITVTAVGTTNYILSYNTILGNIGGVLNDNGIAPKIVGNNL